MDFEYDFERDELAAHHVTFEEAVECFFSDFEVRRILLERIDLEEAAFAETKRDMASR